MENKTDEFLAGLETEDVTSLNSEQNELFPEEIIQEEKYEKPVSYRKDEKLQRYIEKQVEKKLRDFTPSSEETFKRDLKDSGDDDIVRAFTRLVGNDTDEKKSVLADLKEALDKRDERATDRAYSKLQEYQQQQEEKEEQEEQEAKDELDEGREEIELSRGKELTDRQWNAYKEFLIEIEPRGGYQEYPDFVKTFDKFVKLEQANRPSNAQAKSLASRGIERSAPVTESKPKEVGWGAVDRMLDSMRK